MPQWQDPDEGWIVPPQPSSRYHAEENMSQVCSRPRYNDDEARKVLDHRQVGAGRYGSSQGDASGLSPVKHESRASYAQPVTASPEGRWHHDLYTEDQDQRNAPLGPGPTEPIHRSDYKAGPRNHHGEFSPAYGIRGTGVVEHLPPREHRVNNEGSHHRVYPAPVESSPPDNIDQGWGDDTAPEATLSARLERVKVSEDVWPSSPEPVKQSIQAHRYVDRNAYPQAHSVVSTLEVEVKASQGSYIPWEPVRYENDESAAEEPVTREEMLEVLSHMRRDREGIEDSPNNGRRGAERGLGGVEGNQMGDRSYGRGGRGFDAPSQRSQDEGWGNRAPRLPPGDDSHGIDSDRPAKADDKGAWGTHSSGPQANDDGWGDDSASASPQPGAWGTGPRGGMSSTTSAFDSVLRDPPKASTQGIHPDRLLMMGGQLPKSQNPNSAASRSRPADEQMDHGGNSGWGARAPGGFANEANRHSNQAARSYGGHSGPARADAAQPRGAWADRMGNGNELAADNRSGPVSRGDGNPSVREAPSGWPDDQHQDAAAVTQQHDRHHAPSAPAPEPINAPADNDEFRGW